jgi:tetratricopeptide (TPR) repeat protein
MKRVLTMRLALRVLAGLVLCAGTEIDPGQVAANGSQDLRSRLQAAAETQQTGDASAVADASKRVLAQALREMAELRSSVGLFSSGIPLYKQSLDFEDSAGARLSLAIACTQAGRTDDALGEVEKILAAQPNSPAAWNLQGKLWMMKKEYSKAADSLGKSLALQNDPEVAYTRATALLKTNQFDQAAEAFRQIEAASGDKAEGHIMVGRAYEGVNLMAEAEAEYKRAIALDAKASRGHYFLGLLYLTRNGWDPTPEARQEFAAEVALNPDDFFGNYFMGYLTSVEKNYEESDRYLKIALKARPDWPEPYLYLGLNEYGEGYNARAEELLRTAIQLTGSDEARNNYQIRRAYFTLGRILTLTGKKEEAAKFLARSKEMETALVINGRQQALASDQAAPGTELSTKTDACGKNAIDGESSDSFSPIPPSLWKSSSMSAAEREQAQGSERELRKILANGYNDLGTSEARRHQYELALVDFHNAERWDAEVQGLMRNLGFAAFFSKNYGESARALKIVSTEDPSDQRALAMLALSLFSIKNYAEAAKVFDHVHDQTLSDPRMAYGWAVSLVRTKDTKRASAVLEKLVALQIPPEMLVLAGQLYSEIGDQKNAEICFQRAKQQDPNLAVPR